ARLGPFFQVLQEKVWTRFIQPVVPVAYGERVIDACAILASLARRGVRIYGADKSDGLAVGTPDGGGRARVNAGHPLGLASINVEDVNLIGFIALAAAG